MDFNKCVNHKQMKAVIQRVSQAQVIVPSEFYSKTISTGFLVLLGIEHDDNDTDIVWLTNKIKGLRIFDDANGVMNLSLLDVSGELLIISQFTLHASTKKGNRPSYLKAAKPEYAVPLYERFISSMKETNLVVKTGIFGADMKISLTNDGPVTIIIDSKNKE